MASRPCFSVLDVHGPGKFGSPVFAPWSFQGSYPSRRTTNKYYQLFERLLKNFDFWQVVLYHPPIHLLCFFSQVLHGGSRPVVVVRFHESWPEEGIVHCVLSLAADDSRLEYAYQSSSREREESSRVRSVGFDRF
jgi:hypothetical protein